MKQSFVPTIVLHRDKKIVEEAVDLLLRKERVLIASLKGNGKEYPFLAIADQASKKIKSHTVKVLSTTSEEELRDFFTELSTDQTPTYAIISVNINKDISWLLHELDNLRIKRGDNFIWLVSAYIGDIYQAFFLREKTVVSTTLFLHFLELDDIRTLFKELHKEFGFSLDTKQQEEIYTYTGGHVGLARTIYLLQKQEPKEKLSIERLLEDPSVIQRIQDIIHEFPPSLLQSAQENTLSLNEQAILKHIDFLQGKDICNKLVTAYLNHQIQGAQFTKTEVEVLQYFRSHKSKLITKQELAGAIWGENNWQQSFSDLAMSQLIHRIRNKLASSNPHAKILTKRGGGYVYQE